MFVSNVINLIGSSLGIKPKLLPVPLSILKFVFILARKSGLSSRLLGNLQIDIEYTKGKLGWEPKIKPMDGFQKTFKY